MGGRKRARGKSQVARYVEWEDKVSVEVAVGCGGVGVGRSLKSRFLFPSFLPLTPDEMLLSFATQSSMRENGVFIKTVEEREGGLGVGGLQEREG